MESQSYSSSSSSTNTHPYLYPREDIKPKQPPPPPPFHSTLHSVRKLPAKPLKKHIAPLPPTPAKIYKVNSVDFKQVVQKLTAAPEFQARRLQSVAPPPLSLSTPAISNEGDKAATLPTLELLPSPKTTTPLSATYRDLMTDTLETKQQKLSDSLGLLSPLGFSLSPSSHAWCSFLLQSPGTLSSLERSTVL